MHSIINQVSRAPKVVCTIGPASESEENIRALIASGMNVVRLNFSHGDHDSHRSNVAKIRRIASEMDACIGILQDLQGPKIRMNAGLPDDGVELLLGEKLVLAASIHNLPLEEALPVDYDILAQDVKVGERLLFADGKMAVKVESIEGEKVICKVTKLGVLHKRKGVNMPDSNLCIPAMTPKDLEDLKLGLELKVDYVALSFVRRPEDLDGLLSACQGIKSPPLLLAKIEKPQAVKCFEQILERLDGIMVARGDLGVEMPMEMLPPVQKELIHKTVAAGKFVITATQMLLSMVDSSLPTRAEVSDVANAMYDGSDAVMLSDETAAGSFPIEACCTMSQIAEATTPHLKRIIKPSSEILQMSESVGNHDVAIGYSACTLADDTNAKFIVACTRSGKTAVAVSRFRPTCPIIGLTHDVNTFHKLSIYWGLIPVMTDIAQTTDELFEMVRRVLIEGNLVEKHDNVIVTAGISMGLGSNTNLLHIITI